MLHRIRYQVDHKQPGQHSLLSDSQAVFSLAVGFVWESARKYTNVLAAGREKNGFQVILRPITSSFSGAEKLLSQKTGK